MFDELVAATTSTHGAAAVDAWARVESAACARRLSAMLTLLDAAYAADGSADRDQWCIDNWAAVCAHLGATTRLTPGATSGLLLVATALRDRFPKVQALFTAGLIDFGMVRTIVNRARLVQDPTTLHTLDMALAKALRSWAPVSQDKTEKTIDALIDRLDPDAVPRTHTRARSRGVDVTYDEASGMADLFGTLFTHDAAALHTRLDTLADTVCPNDPRTRDQRRADALGALSHGADRLACLCDTDDCPAPGTPGSAGVLIHLIAHHDTLPHPGPRQPIDPNPHHPSDPDDGGPDDTDDGGLDDSHPESGTAAAGSVPAELAPPPAPATDDHTASSDSDATDGVKPAYSAGCNADHVEDPAAQECAGLDGVAPPMLNRPLREMTLTELYTACKQNPVQPSTIRPAALINGRLLPGAIARRAARHARIELIVHPGHTPPEPHHRPSKTLADFVRCRDQTCRYPGCRVPATHCDIDHTIPWPYGPTQASNLKALCRHHHLLKTFWAGPGGWKDRQDPNGDVTWTTPDGRRHTTTPGSRLLFPELCQPTAPANATDIPAEHTADAASGLTMPKRHRTRTHDRTYRTTHERELNRTATQREATENTRTNREARRAKWASPEEIPPF